VHIFALIEKKQYCHTHH